MRSVIGYTIIVWLIFLLFYIIGRNIYRFYTRAAVHHVKSGKICFHPSIEAHIYKTALKHDKDLRKKQRIESNLKNMPYKEFTDLSPDWCAVRDLIKLSAFKDLQDKGESFQYRTSEWLAEDGHMGYYAGHVSKDNYDTDTRKVIEELLKDFAWFCEHTCGEVFMEQVRVFEDFLDKKYPQLSDCLGQIVSQYRIVNR